MLLKNLGEAKSLSKNMVGNSRESQHLAPKV